MASLRARDVVKQILSIARKSPMELKPININHIIKESLSLLRATIPSTIEIHHNIRCDSEMILADPTEINQILINLCTNSVQAMEEDTGKLDIFLETVCLDDRSAAMYEDLQAGEHAKLTVQDEGHGIDPEIIDRVFDPYFTTKAVDKGTGMGLAVVYGIIKKHKGAIKVRNRPVKGTIVEVLFPLIEGGTQRESKVSEDLPTGIENILLVDDEESLTQAAKQILERQGYTVTASISSEEALSLFKQNPRQFDLVITDMAMPKMAGDKLARKLMNIRPDIPIILGTGYSSRIDAAKAQKLGIKAFIMKPLERENLLQTVRKVLDSNL